MYLTKPSRPTMHPLGLYALIVIGYYWFPSIFIDFHQFLFNSINFPFFYQYLFILTNFWWIDKQARKLVVVLYFFAQCSWITLQLPLIALQYITLISKWRKIEICEWSYFKAYDLRIKKHSYFLKIEWEKAE